MPTSLRLPLVLASVWLLALSACRRDAPPSAAPSSAALVAGLNEGVAHMGRYDFSAAAAAFTTVVGSHPQSHEAALDLALALINRQREQDAAAAEQLLQPLVKSPQVGLRARYALGLLWLYAGRDADAAPLLTSVANGAPADAYPAYFAGQALLASAPATALDWFTRAQTANPLLRSAYYGAFQALQRLDRAADAAAMLQRFQALENDPRAEVAEFKYTRMGPLATAVTADAPAPPAPRPDGPLFLAAAALTAEAVPWRSGGGPPSVTVVDIDGDGHLDLFAANALDGGAPNGVLLGTDGGWRLDRQHPLAAVRDVRAALWGDLDNDGRSDVVLVRGGGQSALWRQTAANSWSDVTTRGRAATPGVDARDGALIDADHDGDLDVWLTNASGPNALLNNNGDGTFRMIAAQAGIAGGARGSTAAAFVDLDNDRDHDLIVLSGAGPHGVYLNDRVWRYRQAPGFQVFAAARLDAVLGADLDADGRAELYTSGPRGLERWTPDAGGVWQPVVLAAANGADTGTPARLALADVNGDGTLDLLATRDGSWAAWSVTAAGRAAATPLFAGGAPVTTWTVASLDPSHGPSVIAATTRGLQVWAPGPGRYPYLSLATTGRDRASDQLRSNVSGVGTRVAVRTGSRWTAFDTARLQSGPGQSLQPVAVGLGGAAKADFVSLVWTDGVLQTELALDGGRHHVIEETQRQLSSCPVLFADNGRGLTFVTDILGVGGVGFFESPGKYSPAWPREHVLLPEGSLAPREGRFELAIGEPMEEVAYLDRASLVAYDLPAGWQMTLDERKAIAGPAPTSAPIFYREEQRPTHAVNDRGADVTATIRDADLKAAPPGAADGRFIGLTAPHTLELTFDAPIDRGPGRPVLMIDGWLEYPYAQTIFAAWQANAVYAAPTLEARGGDGQWRTIAREFGYPAGMPRRMTVPLPHLPAGTTALRLRTTQEIYWDRISVIHAQAAPGVVKRVLPLAAATLRASGFATRTTGPQRTPFYDYDRRAPLWDTRHQRGWYTRFGPVDPLLAQADSAVAVLGPGEEVALSFTAGQDAVPDGWTRRFVLETEGWCKDMDLYTQDGDTVAPLPGTNTPARQRLHAAFNTRYESGR